MKSINWKIAFQGKVYEAKKLNNCCFSYNDRMIGVTNGKENKMIVYFSKVQANHGNDVNIIEAKPKAGVKCSNIYQDNCILLEENIVQLRVHFQQKDMHTKFEILNEEQQKKEKFKFKPIDSKSKSTTRLFWEFRFEIQHQEIRDLFYFTAPISYQRFVADESMTQLNRNSYRQQVMPISSPYIPDPYIPDPGLLPPLDLEDEEFEQILKKISVSDWIQQYSIAYKKNKIGNESENFSQFMTQFYEYCLQVCKEKINLIDEQIIVDDIIIHQIFHKYTYNYNEAIYNLLLNPVQGEINNILLPPLCCVVYLNNKKFYCQLNHKNLQYLNDQQQLFTQFLQLQQLPLMQILLKDAKILQLSNNIFGMLETNYSQLQSEISINGLLNGSKSKLHQLMRDIDYMKVEVVDSESLSKIFHKHHVKMQQLGQAATISENLNIKQLCTVEMIARSIKTYYREIQIYDYASEIKQLLKHFFSESTNELTILIDKQILKRFQFKFNSSSAKLPGVLLLNSLMYHMQFTVDLLVKEMIAFNHQFEPNIYKFLNLATLSFQGRGKYYTYSNLKHQKNSDQKRALNYQIIQELQKIYIETRLPEDQEFVEKSYSLLFGECSYYLGQFYLTLSQITKGTSALLGEALTIFENTLPKDHEIFGYVHYQIYLFFKQTNRNRQDQLHQFKQAINYLKLNHDNDFRVFEYCQALFEQKEYQEAYQNLQLIENYSEEIVNMGFELEKQLKIIGSFTEQNFNESKTDLNQNIVFIKNLQSNFKIFYSTLDESTRRYLWKLQYCINNCDQIRIDESNISIELQQFVNETKIQSPTILFSQITNKFKQHTALLEFHLGVYRKFCEIIATINDSLLKQFFQFYQVIAKEIEIAND